MTSCTHCMYFTYNEELNAYACTISIDQDDYARMHFDSQYQCPYFRMGDDYTIVKKQL